MKFIAILRQAGEGCDYTIGCGVSVIELEADDAVEAGKKLKVIVFENYDNSEVVLKSAEYYPVGGKYIVDTERWHAEFERFREEEIAEKIKQNELAELQRLQRKYGTK